MLIIWFGAKNFYLEQTHPFKQDNNCSWRDLAGLEVSDNVFYKGSVIGQVTNIRLSNNQDNLPCKERWLEV